MKDQYFQIFLNLFLCFFIQFLILFEGFSQEKTSSDQPSQTKTVDAGNEGCFKCHDPHSYKIFTRHSESISKIVEYNNNMCLSCHGKARLDQLKSSEKKILKIHDWLPNEYLHFKNVRCIECHSPEKKFAYLSQHIRQENREPFYGNDIRMDRTGLSLINYNSSE